MNKRFSLFCILTSIFFFAALSGRYAQARTMPEFQKIARWMNSPALSKKDLEGKVVLVSFWTNGCYNCINTMPYVNDWYEKYADQGLVIVGVHTPEFNWEGQETRVQAAINKYHIRYPVALDNSYATWKAYSNRYWPAHYFIDKKGVIRYQHFGEGHYKQSEAWIQKLLAE